MNSSIVLAFSITIGVILLFALTLIGLFLSLRGAGGRENISRRLETYAYIPDVLQGTGSRGQNQRLRLLRLRINNLLGSVVSRKLSGQLSSANWPITTTEFALIRFGSTILAFLLGWGLSGSFLPGIGLGLIAYLAPVVMLRRSITQRRLKFEKQLVDILVLMTGAVRAGYSILQALSVVEEEISAPASEEIARVTREVELGRSLTAALNGMAARMENDDLQLVVTSININQQVGGNMATILEAVTATIRERQRLFGEVRAQTSQQRFTGYFLSLLPVIVAALLFVINPDYMSSLFDVICIPIGALVSVLIGNILMRQLMNIKI